MCSRRRWPAVVGVPSDAERVLAVWRESGQSVAAFARQHGLSHVRLLRWRMRLTAAPVFHPVRVVAHGRPVAAVEQDALELELRGGRRIRVAAGFDAELLEKLVRAVEGFEC